MEWLLRVSVLALILSEVRSQEQAEDSFNCRIAKSSGYFSLNKFTERCYEFVYKEEDRLSWSDARQYCQDNNGRLVNIDQRDKQDWLERYLNRTENEYNQMLPPSFDPVDETTWKGYDPDVWIGAWMDSDSSWKFDQFSMSRSGGRVVLTWFNWGTDEIDKAYVDVNWLRSQHDVCLFMRYTPTKRWVNNTITGTAYQVTDAKYPWYKHSSCSIVAAHRHPFICEYEGYRYRTAQMSPWLLVICVLSGFMACGFLACTIYCLWDKIHTSYNVLQV